jgi:hypothetical protein
MIQKPTREIPQSSQLQSLQFRLIKRTAKSGEEVGKLLMLLFVDGNDMISGENYKSDHNLIMVEVMTKMTRPIVGKTHSFFSANQYERSSRHLSDPTSLPFLPHLISTFV